MSKSLVPVRDIQFTDKFDGAKARRLVEALSRLTDEVRSIQQLLDGGDTGETLVKNSGKDYDADWGAGGGGGGGEANTGANVGTGVGVFRDKTGVTLNFRSLVSLAGITLAVVGDEIQIGVSATLSGYPVELGHAGI